MPDGDKTFAEALPIFQLQDRPPLHHLPEVSEADHI